MTTQIEIPAKVIRNRPVPELGIGTWELNHEDCREAVAKALDLGCRHIDEAAVYGNEEAAGEAIEASGIPRDELFITSKVWREGLAPVNIKQSCEESLRRLRTDHLDLLLIHWPNPDFNLEDSLEAMVKLREHGKIKELGVSNFPPSWMRRALDVAPVFCNQVEYHPFLDQSEIHAICKEHDVLLTAYSPLAHGEVPGAETLERIGKEHGKSSVQVALRWLIQQDKVAAIPRSSKAEHIEADFDIYDFELSSEDVRDINALPKDKRQIDPPFAEDWQT